jgi:hypothetical protein
VRVAISAPEFATLSDSRMDMSVCGLLIVMAIQFPRIVAAPEFAVQPVVILPPLPHLLPQDFVIFLRK